MSGGILKLTLALCLGAASAPSALAQAAAPITEQEAHAIAVDAYVYFYSLMSMDVSRKQFTNGMGDFKGPMNTFVNVGRISAGQFQRRRAVQLRHAVFRFLAGHDQGACRHLGTRYQWTILSAADARHVDRRLCITGLANDGHQGGDLSGDAPGLAARSARQIRRGVQASEGYPAHRRADALCLAHWPHQDRRPAGL